MLAVIGACGKQYKVKSGDRIVVDRLPLEVGSSTEIRDVFVISEDGGQVIVGNPLIEGAVVRASVLDQKKHKTVCIFKKNRRKNYRRKNGHRQPLTVLQIEEILH
ncbi:MAG: 50S ribosomal protein L21 [Holosporaceae bacterium]|jgi:large subunit ribosomal protein L21|nr:50S ribosomal protein L21 [Holosporaceae bacterium]